jgi:hypothetical protein
MTGVRGEQLPAAADTASKKPDQTWQVWAIGYPPCGGRRTNWLLIVPCCPHCSGPHHHRGGPDGGIRRAGCDRGAYVVLVRSALNEVAA